MADSTTKNLVALIKNVDNLPGVEDCSKSKMYLRQWFATTNFFLVIMLLGMAHGHTAILLQQLQLPSTNTTQNMRFENGEIFNKPEIVVTSLNLQSWIASIMVLFMCPGCWILALCSKKIGRKTILLIAVAVFTISWIGLAFASNTSQLLIGRSLSGLCMGILAGLTSVYQGEIAIPKLRSTLNAVLTVSFSAGVLLSHAVGTWFHWRTTALFSGVIGLITVFLNYYTPESPIWLLNRNRWHEAIYSWTFLRGIRDMEELKSMHVVKIRKSSQVIEKKLSSKKYCAFQFLKPLVIIIMLFTVAQMSGMGAVTFYCIQMISEISGPENAYIPTLILDVFRFLFSIVLTVCTKRYSTRKLSLFSAFSCSLCLISLATCIIFKIGPSWTPLILLFIYEATVVMGIGPLPWTFCGELFSVSCKEVGVGIVTNYNYILFFIIVKINPYLYVLLQPGGTFLFYGSFTLSGAIVLYFILPDTRNKSLKEIESMFTSN